MNQKVQKFKVPIYNKYFLTNYLYTKNILVILGNIDKVQKLNNQKNFSNFSNFSNRFNEYLNEQKIIDGEKKKMRYEHATEAGISNNYGKDIIVSLETGKTLDCIFLGYRENEDGNTEMNVEESGAPLSIPLSAIKVVHLRPEINTGDLKSPSIL